MSINYDIIHLIDFLAFTQAILLGCLLIFGKRKNLPSKLLGLFLITYSFDATRTLLVYTGITYQYPVLNYLPNCFYFLSLPLFYLYAKSLISPFSIKKNIYFLIPGIIEFCVFSILFIYFLFNPKEANAISDFTYNNYWYAATVFTIFFAILTIRFVNIHQKKILGYFSNLEKRQLLWVKRVAIFLILIDLIWLIPLSPFDNIIDVDDYIEIIIIIIHVFFIYWVGISGLQQPNIDMKLDAPPVKNYEENPQTEYNKTYEQLLELMENKKLYKESDLTLPDLANELKVTRRSLSQLINQNSGTNFNQFINQYRINEAKKILIDKSYDNLNMLGVACKAGFNSKATFFLVFKKIENKSPGEYKKQFSA